MKLTLNQKALGYAALYKDPTAPVAYIPGTIKTLKKTLQSENEQKDLIALFKKDPKDILAYCRQALQHIAKDSQLSEVERFDRAKRYVKQYLDLIVKLDADGFDHNATAVHEGIPDYIPDGFVDMGSDPRLPTNTRYRREKIIINKKKIFQDASSILYDILSHPGLSKKDIVNRIYYYITQKQYSHSIAQTGFSGQSIKLHDVDNNNQMICRHKALLFQVLVQSCGITSKLLKCDLQFGNNEVGGHAANLIRIDYKWYLVDVTNPIKGEDGKARYAITSIPEAFIDLNKYRYRWVIDKNIVRPRKYTSRNNMYYQVR